MRKSAARRRTARPALAVQEDRRERIPGEDPDVNISTDSHRADPGRRCRHQDGHAERARRRHKKDTIVIDKPVVGTKKEVKTPTVKVTKP